MKFDLTDVKTMKSGTNYITLRIPKRIFNKLPDGYFFIDINVDDVRGGLKDAE